MTNKTGAEPASRGFRGSAGTAPQAHDTARKEERSTTTDGTQVRAQRGGKGVSEEGAIINRDLPPRRARRASLLTLLRESAGLPLAPRRSRPCPAPQCLHNLGGCRMEAATVQRPGRLLSTATGKLSSTRAGPQAPQCGAGESLPYGPWASTCRVLRAGQAPTGHSNAHLAQDTRLVRR